MLRRSSFPLKSVAPHNARNCSLLKLSPMASRLFSATCCWVGFGGGTVMPSLITHPGGGAQVRKTKADSVVDSIEFHTLPWFKGLGEDCETLPIQFFISSLVLEELLTMLLFLHCPFFECIFCCCLAFDFGWDAGCANSGAHSTSKLPAGVNASTNANADAACGEWFD